MRTPITPSFDTAYNLMSMIKAQIDTAQVDPLGLKVLSQPTMWLSSDRATVRNTFDGLVFQSLDLLGLPRIALPVEYVAAAIVAFVHPANYFAACQWSESHGATTDEMALSGEYDRFSARELFAVVCNVYARHDGVGCGTFESRLDAKVSSAINPVNEPPLMEDDYVNQAK